MFISKIAENHCNDGLADRDSSFSRKKTSIQRGRQCQARTKNHDTIRYPECSVFAPSAFRCLHPHTWSSLCDNMADVPPGSGTCTGVKKKGIKGLRNMPAIWSF